MGGREQDPQAPGYVCLALRALNSRREQAELLGLTTIRPWRLTGSNRSPRCFSRCRGNVSKAPASNTTGSSMQALLLLLRRERATR